MAVDDNIQQKANDIRMKIYGEQVRESLASGLEAMSTDVVENGTQFQAVIDSTTGKAVISAPEIIVARDGEANLNARLDKENQAVSAQLAQKVEKGNVTVSDINKNLGKLDQTYMTDDFIAQFVDNTQSINALPADNSITAKKLANKAVINTKLAFTKLGKNLFNKYTVIADNGLSGSAGTTFPTTGINTSDYIAVVENTVYVQSHKFAIAFYDSNQVFISGFTSATSTFSFVTPLNAQYMRVSVSDANLDVMQIERNTLATNYEPYFNVLNNVRLEETAIKNKTISADKTTFFVKGSGTANLFNPNDTEHLTDKLLNNDGRLTQAGSYNTTGYIEVYENDNIYVSRESGSSTQTIISYGFFDENKIWVAGKHSSVDGVISNPIIVPNGVVYIRLSYGKDSVEYQIEKGNSVTNYVNYIEKYYFAENIGFSNNDSETANYWKGKKVVFNGDSITSGFASNPPYYPAVVANNLGMSLSNFARGGSTISVKETDPANRDPIVTRFDEMDSDADLIIIAGGTNDHSYAWTPIGTMSDRTNYTFYGSLHNLCLGLINKYIGKQILFMTPIKRYKTPNSRGETLEQYAEIIKEVCSYYGIPVLDMFREATLNMEIPSQATALFADDGGHPNQAGHEVMARRVSGYLKQLA